MKLVYSKMKEDKPAGKYGEAISLRSLLVVDECGRSA